MSGDPFVDQIANAVADRLTQIHGRRKRLLSLEETAVYMGLSEDAVMDLVKAGKLTTTRPTRKVQFDVYDLDDFIESLKRDLYRSGPKVATATNKFLPPNTVSQAL